MTGPLLSLELPVHRLPGCAFGVPEAVSLLRLGIADRGEEELARLEAALAGLLEEDLPARPGDQPVARRIADLFGFAVGALQRQSRIPVATRHVLVDSMPAKPAYPHLLAVPAPQPEASRLAVTLLLRAFHEVDAGTVDVEALRESANDALRGQAPSGVNTFLIARAAQRLGVPLQGLVGSTLVLGTGRWSRMVDSTLTDATPAIATRIARSKQDTAAILRSAGLPGGVNMLVKSAQEAVAAAARLGYPAVVKPEDRDRGEGVSADLRSAQAVAKAYEEASRFSSNILVERWAPGATHRLMVFNGRVLRVMRRIAGGVTGDGVHTVAELLALELESQHHARVRRRKGTDRLSLDEEALDLLAQEGLAADTVPPAGQYVRLRRRDNINAGGRNDTIPLEEVHPDNLRLALDAAALLRLDVAGVDLIMEDIRRSWFGTSALICEINSQPQFGVREPELYDAMIRELVGGEGRIPARLVILRDDGADALRRARESAPAGCSVSCAEGLWVDGRRATRAFPDGFLAARALLRRTDVSSALCIMTLADVARRGLPLDRWDAIELPRGVADGTLRRDLEHVRRMVAAHGPQPEKLETTT